MQHPAPHHPPRNVAADEAGAEDKSNPEMNATKRASMASVVGQFEFIGDIAMAARLNQSSSASDSTTTSDSSKHSKSTSIKSENYESQ
jgi:hypothetical protein